MVGNLLTTLVSVLLSNDSGSILLNTRYKAKNNTITFPYKRFTLWNFISIRSQQVALISSRMINSAICCKSEKRFPLICYTQTPL